MPSPDAILSSATLIASRWWPLAVAWHAALGVLLVAVWRGWRPGRAIAASILAFPLLGVSGLAWSVGNPFNGTVFAALAVMLGWQAASLPPGAVTIASPPAYLPGAALVAFAWVYPHFLGDGVWRYLAASPLGLIPCPTLAAVIGLAIVFRLYEAPEWAATVALAGVAYGVIGVWYLGVHIDMVLLAGAALLLALAAGHRLAHPRAHRTEWKVAA